MRLAVLRGDTVRSGISGERRAQWRALVERQTKVAVYQSPELALSWYEVYEPRYEPLLLLAEDDAGAILGAMPLAVARDAPGRLVFAGAEQAEYSGWVAVPELEDEFPARCLAWLHQGGWLSQPWHWKWLTPGAGTAWLEHPLLRERGIGWSAGSSPNPLLSLHDPAARRFFAADKYNHKRKTSRLSKLGEVRLVRLTADTLSNDLFEVFTTLCDIRYLARHGVTPFRDDPLKGPFYRRLLEQAPEAVLLFALMAGETPVAFHFDIADKRRAIFGMSPFDPRWGKSSPGKLIADRVAGALRELGMEVLDLTPGDDEYKQEVASRHETVHSIRLFPTRAAATRYHLRQVGREGAKRIALGLGITRERFARARRFASDVRRHSPLELTARILRRLRRWLYWQDAFLVVHVLPVGPNEPAVLAEQPKLPLHENMLVDFLAYSGSNPALSRQGMMRQAIHRAERGEYCFTLVEDGVLLLYGWLQMEPKRIRVTEVDLDIRPEPGDAAMYDFYVEPHTRGRGLYKQALRNIFARIYEMGAKRIVGGAMESNEASRRGIISVGATPYSRLVNRRVLGRTQRWEELCP